MKRVFYGPADWIVARTSARGRRAVGFWTIPGWIFIGGSLVGMFPSAVWLNAAMLIVNGCFSGWALLAAETPVEGEQSDE